MEKVVDIEIGVMIVVDIFNACIDVTKDAYVAEIGSTIFRFLLQLLHGLLLCFECSVSDADIGEFANGL
jgi:hypothetical protein